MFVSVALFWRVAALRVSGSDDSDVSTPAGIFAEAPANNLWSCDATPAVNLDGVGIIAQSDGFDAEETGPDACAPPGGLAPAPATPSVSELRVRLLQ